MSIKTIARGTGHSRKLVRNVQRCGQGYEALAAEHDVGVLEAGVGEPEVVEPMVEAQAGGSRRPACHGAFPHHGGWGSA